MLELVFIIIKVVISKIILFFVEFNLVYRNLDMFICINLGRKFFNL